MPLLDLTRSLLVGRSATGPVPQPPEKRRNLCRARQRGHVDDAAVQQQHNALIALTPQVCTFSRSIDGSPDAGGSTHLATQLNQARDISLRQIR